jgi:hypothetical protein
VVCEKTVSRGYVLGNKRTKKSSRSQRLLVHVPAFDFYPHRHIIAYYIDGTTQFECEGNNGDDQEDISLQDRV